MFPHISTLVSVLFYSAILAAATPRPWDTTTTSATVTTTVTVTAPGPTVTAEPASQCNTGDLQCCNSIQSASSPSAATLLGLLGVVLTDVNVPIGVTCSPISVIGVGGDSCSAAPVCCENNSFNGVVAIGCVPVNLSL